MNLMEEESNAKRNHVLELAGDLSLNLIVHRLLVVHRFGAQHDIPQEVLVFEKPFLDSFFG